MKQNGKRGEVWFTDIKGKTRPVLIISNDEVVVDLERVLSTIRNYF